MFLIITFNSFGGFYVYFVAINVLKTLLNVGKINGKFEFLSSERAYSPPNSPPSMIFILKFAEYYEESNGI